MNAQKFIHFWMEKITDTNLIFNDYFKNEVIKNSEMMSFITITLKNLTKKQTLK